MKKLFLLSVTLTLLLMSLTCKSQIGPPPFFTTLPSTQCFTGIGTASWGSVQVQPPGAASYSWMISGTNPACAPIQNLLSPNGSVIDIQFQCCGIYTLICTAFGANNMPISSFTGTAQVTCTPTLTINSQPGSLSLCSGSSATLSASGATSYTWLPGNVVSPGLTVTPTSNTCYTVTGVNSSTCSGSSVACVTVQTAGNIAVTSSTPTICTGNNAVLTASGAASYSWNTGANTASVSVSPTINTTYTVTGNPGGGCSSTQTIALSVNPVPTLSLSTNAKPLCKGKSATLTVSGAASYSWAGVTSTVASLVVSPTITTNYTVTGTNTLNCSAKTTITQSVSSCTGLTDYLSEEKVFELYPNPTNGILNLHAEKRESILNIEVYNVVGKLIMTKKMDVSTSEIDLSSHPPGIYYVEITDGTKTRSFKVIKN